MSTVTWDAVAAARERIAPFVHRTPVMTCSAIDERCRATVFFKCESFQRTGSFKFRGASNAVASLPPARRAHGVYAHSSGNHAQALALAARLHGLRAILVMPEDSNPLKVRATEGYGAEIVFCPPTHDGRREVAERVGAESGAAFVHPHDDPAVISGQGTAVIELLESVGALDLVFVPVGGGGLTSGTAVALSHLAPDAEVIGCEPAQADDAYRSLLEGRRITEFTPATIADGLRTPLGENTFALIREHVKRILRVEEEEILPAMRFVWERMKLVIEPSSAVAVAPLLAGLREARGKRVGVILTGGNVDITSLPTLGKEGSWQTNSSRT
ncbi:MAG: pyridoxal-phosphate dependent enzyme [Candidatus Bipolaricaulota bacterium]|nr:MAG: pyridoxal-phosphate dependent enzyme [Candidatus Bipolaricaulota bacterium]